MVGLNAQNKPGDTEILTHGNCLRLSQCTILYHLRQYQCDICIRDTSIANTYTSFSLKYTILDLSVDLCRPIVHTYHLLLHCLFFSIYLKIFNLIQAWHKLNHFQASMHFCASHIFPALAIFIGFRSFWVSIYYSIIFWMYIDDMSLEFLCLISFIVPYVDLVLLQ